MDKLYFEMRPNLRIGDKVYPIYQDTIGQYYYRDGNKYNIINDKDVLISIAQNNNKPTTISATPAGAPLSSPTQKPASTFADEYFEKLKQDVLSADNTYLTGDTYFSNGYQPNTINGYKLKASGKTVGDTKLKGSTSYNGKVMDSQQIWEDELGHQWIWVRDGETSGYYIQYHEGFGLPVNFADPNSQLYKDYMTGFRDGTRTTNTTTWKSNTTTTNPPSNTGSSSIGGGGSSTASGSPNLSGGTTSSSGNDIPMQEPEKPPIYTAEELAEIYGVADSYNYENLLNDYNNRTNEYYDSAVANQEALRSAYLRNNSQYMNNVVNSYLDSYKNAAPTAMGKGTIAANALSTQLGAGRMNSSNDYGMLQSVNNLEEGRQAELASNPQAAKEYYNNIGLMLSNLSSNINTSQVQQYVDQLDAYGKMYASLRTRKAYEAQAAAANFSGLAYAGATNAEAAAGGLSAWDNLYNFYYNYYKDSKKASNAVTSDLLASGGL